MMQQEKKPIIEPLNELTEQDIYLPKDIMEQFLSDGQILESQQETNSSMDQSQQYENEDMMEESKQLQSSFFLLDLFNPDDSSISPNEVSDEKKAPNEGHQTNLERVEIRVEEKEADQPPEGIKNERYPSPTEIKEINSQIQLSPSQQLGPEERKPIKNPPLKGNFFLQPNFTLQKDSRNVCKINSFAKEIKGYHIFQHFDQQFKVNYRNKLKDVQDKNPNKLLQDIIKQSFKQLLKENENIYPLNQIQQSKLNQKLNKLLKKKKDRKTTEKFILKYLRKINQLLIKVQRRRSFKLSEECPKIATRYLDIEGQKEYEQLNTEFERQFQKLPQSVKKTIFPKMHKKTLLKKQKMEKQKKTKKIQKKER